MSRQIRTRLRPEPLRPRGIRRTALGLVKPGAAPINPGRDILILAEEPVEIGRIAEAEAVADLFDRQIELLQARAGLVDQPRVDDGARAASLLALAVGMQPVVGDAERRRIARDRPAVAVMQ